MAVYTFNTRVVFLLGKFIKHFESNIDDLTKMVESVGGYTPGDDVLAKIGPEKFLKLLFDVIGSASEAEDIAIKLLAVASRRSEVEIQQMDGHEFIKEMKEFLMSIDWGRLMGELMPSTEGHQPEPKKVKQK